MAQDFIKIRGARVHNLRNIDLDIPKNKLVVVTGISGSGKSSLAFDTLYAEGQRRYIESLSAYARQFLGVMQKPDVDKIEGISPAISIDQRKAAHNPRSTVGTVTEIYDYLRLLFARIGKPHCPKCGKLISRQTIDQIVEQILSLGKINSDAEIIILGPIIRGKKGEHRGVLEEIKRGGFVRVRIDGIIYRVDEVLPHLPERSEGREMNEVQRTPSRSASRGSVVDEAAAVSPPFANARVVDEAAAVSPPFANARVVDEAAASSPPFARLRLARVMEEALEKTLDRNKKHNLEVVVDRLIIDKDLDRSRLVDSAETALKLGKGITIVNWKLKIGNLKTKSGDLVFSEHFACEKCGVSLPELEPRLFSFNSPYGACSACQGLGERLEVDPKLVIPNPNLSIAEGAIFPWARASHKVGRQGFFWWKLEELSESYNFSLHNPVKNLSQKILNLILHGSSGPKKVLSSSSSLTRAPAKGGDEATDSSTTQAPAKGGDTAAASLTTQAPAKGGDEATTSLTTQAQRRVEKNRMFFDSLNESSIFEGVIPWLERRYHETDSEYTREEIEKYMVEKKCEKCQGKRLKPEVLAVTVGGYSIDSIVGMSIAEVKKFFEKLLTRATASLTTRATAKGGDEAAASLTTGKNPNSQIPITKKFPIPKSQKIGPWSLVIGHSEFRIAQPIIKEIINRLQFLIDVGLNYLTLDRKAATLAGGEEQRIRLATQIGSKLTGVLYILDEPSVGLHARDQGRLIETLKKLRDLGNTVAVVEHDYQTILSAHRVIDIGPGAGKRGGKVIFEGTPKELMKSNTLTGKYLSGRLKVVVNRSRLSQPVSVSSKVKRQTTPSDDTGSETDKQKTNYLIIKKAAEHNLKNIDVKIPLGKFVCITGVSGSGKSTLMNDILARALMKKFYKSKEEPGKYGEILGTEHLNKVVLVDQSPIGRTPRSNPATYTGCFSYVRDLFSRTREAKIRGYQPGRFSFNVKGGRCEACEGQGVKKIEMYFLPDVYVQCSECKGKRFNKETLTVEYKGKNISDVLEMTTEEALEFFKNILAINQKLKTLNDVGLGYIQLGQPAPSLSGGEAQRVKLATELSKKDTGKSLYILDEPTTGLHPHDIKKLVWVLMRLVEKGNTVLSIEHNTDIIRNSDWCIDLGPEGGEEGGYIIAEGTPLEISKNKQSYTGRYLKSYTLPRSR